MQIWFAFYAVSAGWVFVRLYWALTGPVDREDRLPTLRRHVSSLAGFGMLIAAALDMAITKADHRTWLAGGVVILLGSATTVSWELLLRIARMKLARPDAN